MRFVFPIHATARERYSDLLAVLPSGHVEQTVPFIEDGRGTRTSLLEAPHGEACPWG